jgi:hypothetical protein
VLSYNQQYVHMYSHTARQMPSRAALSTRFPRPVFKATTPCDPRPRHDSYPPVAQLCRTYGEAYMQTYAKQYSADRPGLALM